MDGFIQQIISFFGGLDYLSITFLMTLESSIFPVPSELVMIPAGYLIYIGKLNFIFTILAGTIGSIIGAILNYFILGQFIGKPFLLKYGKYILITKEDYIKTEKLFLKNDKLYTFLGRLIPVVRHLISIPAGIFKMNFIIFVLITGFGAALWCTILTLFGYYFGESIIDKIMEYSHIVKYIIIFCILIGIFLKIKKYYFSKN